LLERLLIAYERWRPLKEAGQIVCQKKSQAMISQSTVSQLI